MRHTSKVNCAGSAVGCGLRLLSLVFVLALALGFGVGRAAAAEDGKTYALVFSTGENVAGKDLSEDIQFIRIKYEAADGSGEHYHYIFPGDGEFQKSLEWARQAGETTQTVEQRIAQLGYTAGGFAGHRAFQTYATDTLLFQPVREVKSFLGMEFFTKNTGTWNCQDIRLYEVTELRGLRMSGYLSDQYYVDFQGELMMRLQKPQSFSWAVGRLFRLTTQGKGDGELVAYEEPQAYGAQSSEYAFRLDIADQYGGGIEALAAETKMSLRDAAFCEAAVIRVRYLDIYGMTREANIPLITGALGLALEQGMDVETALAGVAQQGNTLAVRAALPDFKSFVSVQLLYGPQEAQAAAGLGYTGGQTSRHDRRAQSIKDNSDTLYLTAFSFYDMANTTITVGESGGMLVPTFQGTPVSYFRATTVQGIPYEPDGTPVDLEMTAYKAGAALLPREDTERYLVVLETDTPDFAGTTSSLKMIMKYTDLAGVSRTSAEFDVKECAREYYGYWPGVSEDFAYLAGMSPGQQLSFLIQLNDVDTFDGAEMRLENKGDEWQMSGIRIYRIDTLSPRMCTWQTVSGGGQTSDRMYSRDIGTENILLDRSGQSILIQSGSTYEQEFKSESSISVQEKDDNWSEIKYAMTYEQSKNLGDFTKSNRTYQVAVKVGSDVVNSAGYGDCGSKNQFYFQLVFEEGTSGYVLANQQLSADGFRTGYEETFTIQTHRDYGELTAVRIIPEDPANPGDVFDKLKVEKIMVRRLSDSTVSRQWSINQVGWIDIDYRDSGAENTGRPGRSEAEMSRVYRVDYGSYVYNLEFAITTGVYDAEDPQFQGEVTGQLIYRNHAGQRQPITFDVVQAMSDYMDKDAFYQENGANATSDPAYLFRGSHTDRFRLSVDDVQSVEKLILKAKADEQTYWPIQGVSVTLVSGEGTLFINKDDEYQRRMAEGSAPLCTQTSTKIPAYKPLCMEDETQEVDIGFTDNTIPKIEEEEGKQGASIISREPASKNDTLNLYVYMTADEMSSPISDYKLVAAVDYKGTYSGSYQSSAVLKHAGGDSRMLYALGVGASNMAGINRMRLAAEAVGTSGVPIAKVDYAIVQQIRAGVVVGTYYFNFGNSDAFYVCSAKPEALPENTASRQVVSLSLGGGTEESLLYSEKRDVAVSLRYTTTNSMTNLSYDSPYIYLTDQQYLALKAGKIVDIVFTEPYLKEVTGLTLVATGGVAVEVDSACVTTYQLSKEVVTETDAQTGQEKKTEREVKSFTGLYSFAHGAVLDAKPVTLTPTSAGLDDRGTVSQLTMTFVTAQAEAGRESGTSGPVSMTVAYLDQDGARETVTFPDIRSHITNGATGFAAGSTVTARFQLAGVQELLWVSLEPWDSDVVKLATWKLESLSGKLVTGSREESFTRSVNRWFEEGNLHNAGAIGLNVRVNVSATAGGTVQSATNDAAALLVQSGQPVVLRVNVEGASGGYTVKAEQIVKSGDGEDSVAQADQYLTTDGGTVLFAAPNNYSGANITYRITIASREVPSCTARVKVTMQYEEKPQTPAVEMEPG